MSARWTRYVAVGDSLSEGLGDPLPGGGLRGWAMMLAEYLRQASPELAFTNLAVRGYRVRDAIRTQVRPALELEPDLITAFIGGNNVLLDLRLDSARLAHDLDRLIARLARPDITLVMSTLPDITACSLLLPPLRGRVRRRVETVNEVTRGVARRHGTLLLDAWEEPATRRHDFWSVDRIHPSSAGHRVIAQNVAGLLGVPVPTSAEQPGSTSPLAVAQRYAAEATWLVRHGARPPRTAG